MALIRLSGETRGIYESNVGKTREVGEERGGGESTDGTRTGVSGDWRSEENLGQSWGLDRNVFRSSESGSEETPRERNYGKVFVGKSSKRTCGDSTR